MTVEDSSMDFQHLRDLSDVRWCLSKGFFKWALQYYKKKPTLEEYKQIALSTDERKQIQAELKLTKNQINRVFEILKLAIGVMENTDFFVEYKNKIKTRLYFVNRIGFLPFLRKKYPYLFIDSNILLSSFLT